MADEQKELTEQELAKDEATLKAVIEAAEKDEEEKEKKSKNRKKSIRKFGCLFFLLLLLIGGCYFYFMYFFEWGVGSKAGSLNRFVLKGTIFKTYEGKLIQDGLRNGAQSNEFEFSVVNDDIARTLEASAGKEMILHYKEYNNKLIWRGESRFVVDSIISISDRAPLSDINHLTGVRNDQLNNITLEEAIRQIGSLKEQLIRANQKIEDLEKEIQRLRK